MSELLLGVILVWQMVVSLALWHRVRPRVQRPPASPSTRLLDRARVLVAAEEGQDANGELKRHRVYAKLLKEFPAEPRRAVSRAIEDALGD